MGRESLYLKYRPFQLSDIVGQKYIVQTLKQASIDNSFVHTYLFGGIKGTGKTTSARILANLLTCENPVNGVLCGKCRACKSVQSGSSMDIIELDGANNRKVEDIRDLIDGAHWPPTELKRKVYTIDESHQLTSTAISALLKIVEEPPEYVTFIFCTTELDKIPDTILSRSQRFMFGRLSLKEVVGRLKFISEQENIKATEDALYALARMGRGSMRDSIGYLEQIATLASGKEINDKAVAKYFGMADRRGILNMLKSMNSANLSLLMDQVNDLVIANADIKNIVFEISELFRSIMVIKAKNGNFSLIELPEHEIQELMEIGDKIKFSNLYKLSRSFSTLEKEMDWGINKRWILESTLIKCSEILMEQ